MLFWGIAVGWLVFVASGCVDLVGDSDVRWKKIKELITTATADTSKVAISATLGQREEVMDQSADACFDISSLLTFSGARGLPRLSL